MKDDPIRKYLKIVNESVSDNWPHSIGEGGDDTSMNPQVIVGRLNGPDDVEYVNAKAEKYPHTRKLHTPSSFVYEFEDLESAYEFRNEVNQSGYGYPVKQNWDDRTKQVIGFK